MNQQKAWMTRTRSISATTLAWCIEHFEVCASRWHTYWLSVCAEPIPLRRFSTLYFSNSRNCLCLVDHNGSRRSPCMYNVVCASPRLQRLTGARCLAFGTAIHIAIWAVRCSRTNQIEVPRISQRWRLVSYSLGRTPMTKSLSRTSLWLEPPIICHHEPPYFTHWWSLPRVIDRLPLCRPAKKMMAKLYTDVLFHLADVKQGRRE